MCIYIYVYIRLPPLGGEPGVGVCSVLLKRFPHPPSLSRLWVWSPVLRLPPSLPRSVLKSYLQPISIFDQIWPRFGITFEPRFSKIMYPKSIWVFIIDFAPSLASETAVVVVSRNRKSVKTLGLLFKNRYCAGHAVSQRVIPAESELGLKID